MFDGEGAQHFGDRHDKDEHVCRQIDADGKIIHLGQVDTFVLVVLIEPTP